MGVRFILSFSLCLAVCVAFLGGCGSTSTSVLGPTDSRCSVTLALTPQTIGGAGGTGTLTVTTARECLWSVSSSGDWVSFTGATRGQGTSSVPYSVAPNRSLESRTAELSVSGERATIMQQAASCSFAVSPATETVDHDADTVHLALATEEFCEWNSSSSASWLTIAPPTSGTGESRITVRVAANTGAQRSGTLEVAGIRVTITQRAAATPGPTPPAPPPPQTPGCAFTVSPINFSNIAAAGATLTTSVTTTAGCGWTASSGDSWLTASPASGSGSGSVTVTVAANSGGTRSGAVTVAGQNVIVAQAAPPCTYSLKPTSHSAPAAAGSVEVAISTSAGCAWSVSGLPSWAAAKPASGAGSGSTTLSIQANAGPARNATLSIATQNFALSQASGCTFANDRTSFNNVSAAGATITVEIKTADGCQWSATGYPSWITVKPATGSGFGSVAITAGANTGTARNATFQLANQDFTVSQLALSCSYTLKPTSISVSSGSQTRTITVTTQALCPIGASSNASWITITSVPPAGGGSINLSIASNSTSSDRNGNVTVTGLNFTSTVGVSQDGK